jgi:hypothetical protein
MCRSIGTLPLRVNSLFYGPILRPDESPATGLASARICFMPGWHCAPSAAPKTTFRLTLEPQSYMKLRGNSPVARSSRFFFETRAADHARDESLYPKALKQDKADLGFHPAEEGRLQVSLLR